MSQADKDRLEKLKELTNALADTGNEDVARQIADLGRDMEQQINEENK